MKISIIAIAYKGVIGEVQAFYDRKKAYQEMAKIHKGFNYDENDLQIFDDVEIK